MAAPFSFVIFGPHWFPKIILSPSISAYARDSPTLKNTCCSHPTCRPFNSKACPCLIPYLLLRSCHHFSSDSHRFSQKNFSCLMTAYSLLKAGGPTMRAVGKRCVLDNLSARIAIQSWALLRAVTLKQIVHIMTWRYNLKHHSKEKSYDWTTSQKSPDLLKSAALKRVRIFPGESAFL